MVAHTSYAAGIPATTAHAAARRLLQNYGSQSVMASTLAFRASPRGLSCANAHRAKASCKGSLRTGTRTCVSRLRMEHDVLFSFRCFANSKSASSLLATAFLKKKCPTLLHQAAVACVALALRLARCCCAAASQRRHCGKGNHGPSFVSLRRSLLMRPAGFKMSKRLITDSTLNVQQKQPVHRSAQSGG